MDRANWAALRLLLLSPLQADAALAAKLMAFVTAEAATRISLAYWLKTFTQGLVHADLSAAAFSAGGYGASIGAVGVGNLYRMKWITLLQEKTSFLLDQRLMRLSGNAATIEHHEHRDYLAQMELLKENRRQLGDGVGVLVGCAQVFLMLTMALGVLATVNVWLLLLPLFAVPSVLLNRRGARIRNAAAEASAAALRRSRQAFEVASSPEAGKELRLFGLRGEFLDRFTNAWEGYYQINRSAELKALGLTLQGLLLFALGYGGALALVIIDLAAKPSAATAGNLILVLGLAVQVNGLVSGAMGTVSALSGVLLTYRRVIWLERFIMDANKRHAVHVPEEVPATIRKELEFRNVSFAYPGRTEPVLSNISFRAHSGAVVALLGENGAGKSTLIKLMCGFYSPTGGQILLDGKDIAAFPKTQWRARLAGLFQDFLKYEFVARENVGVGDLAHLDDPRAVDEAVDLAGIRDVIDGLPSGLSTQLGGAYAGSTTLSGGEWQKVALARATMRQDPLILFLDEPTSNLDAISEYHIFRKYIEAARIVATRSGAITFLISHRFTTTQEADLVLVVENGVISETGTHQELVARGRLYSELYELQRASYR